LNGSDCVCLGEKGEALEDEEEPRASLMRETTPVDEGNDARWCCERAGELAAETMRRAGQH
jgi:hypothetical protein